MARSYLILKKAYETGDFTEIYDSLDQSIKNLMDLYSYVFEEKTELERFFNLVFKEILDSYFECPPDKITLASYYKKAMVTKIKDVIKGYDDEQIYNMFNRYIDEKITINEKKEVSQYILDLEKIDLLFFRIGLTASSELVGKILANKKIEKIVKLYIDNYNENGFIKGDKIFGASAGIVSSMILELYCNKNSIVIEKSLEDNNKNKKEYKAVEHNSFDPVTMYLKEIGAIPMLSPMEEIKLFKEYHAGSEMAKNRIIEANLRLVVGVAKRFVKDGLELLDLVQYGNFGLYEAVSRFDENSGYKFSTYAIWWVRQKISNNIVTECGNVGITRTMLIDIDKYNAALRELELTLGRDAETIEIAEYLNWSIDKVVNVQLQKSVSKVLSLNTLVRDDNDSSEFGDLIADDVSLEDEILNKTYNEDLHERIFKVIELAKLTDNEKKAILYRFGFITGEKETLEEVGKKLGVTRERIRQLEAKALKKLKDKSSNVNLVSFLDNPEKVLQDKVKQKTPETKKNVVNETSSNISDEIEIKPNTSVSASVNDKAKGKDKVEVKARAKDNGGGGRAKAKVKVNTKVNANTKIFETIAVTGYQEVIDSSIKNPVEKVTPSLVKETLNANASLKSEAEFIIPKEENNILEKNSNSDTIESTNDTVVTTKTSKEPLRNLKSRYDMVPTDILDKIISELSIYQQEIVEKGVVSSLTKTESKEYYNKIIPRVKQKIAEEVVLGNIPSSVLEEYGIKPKKIFNTNLEEKYRKIDSRILNRIASELTEEQQEIIRKGKNSKLGTADRNKYYDTIIPKVEVRIAREVEQGNLPASVLEEYNIKPMKKGPKKVLEYGFNASLEERYRLVGEKKLEEMVLELKDRQQQIVKKRKTSTLTKDENTEYFHNIIPQINYRIAREVERGNLPPSILEEYGIKSYEEQKRRRAGKKGQSNEKKVSEDISVGIEVASIKDLKHESDKVEVNDHNESLDNSGASEDLLNNCDASESVSCEQPNIDINLPFDEKMHSDTCKHIDREVLKARLLTIVRGEETKRLDAPESIFYSLFDESHLNSELNEKMFCYIGLRFGYFDGNNYSDKAISRILTDDEINACKKNRLFYTRHELKKTNGVDNKAGYQKVIRK